MNTTTLIRCFNALRQRIINKGIPDEDLDQMRAWQISSQLAAVPPDFEKLVPPQIAALIRAARDLHPQMAHGAEKRQFRGEPCPDLG